MSQCKHVLVAVVLTCLVQPSVSAQIGKDTNLWLWTGAADHHRSIVRVSLNGAVGTGAIIFKGDTTPGDAHLGICATALHIVERVAKQGRVSVTFFNGQVEEDCKIIQSDASVDLALIQLPVPAEVPASGLSMEVAKNGDAIEIVGLGGGSQLSKLRSFSTKAAAPTNEGEIFADVTLLPGDSGGAVFDQDGHVAGIISGGWFWFDAGVRSADGRFVKATWPARASNSKALRVLLKKAVASELSAGNVQLANKPGDPPRESGSQSR